MKQVAMTFIGSAPEPTPLEAQTHTVKNCVSVILGLASTIERHVEPDARPRVAQLVGASRRLLALLSRRATPCHPVRESVRISDVLQLVFERLRPQAEARGVQLSLDCAGGTLDADFAELAEALYDVGSNALQASPAGGRVQITTRRSADGDHELSVADTGCGIPTSVMRRLGTVGVATREQGTGLGLTLALRAIARHEGLMRIESIEGGGTTVLIWLPGNRCSA